MEFYLVELIFQTYMLSYHHNALLAEMGLILYMHCFSVEQLCKFGRNLDWITLLVMHVLSN